MAEIFNITEAAAVEARKVGLEDQVDSGDDTTPTTTVSECTDVATDDDELECSPRGAEVEEAESESTTAAEEEDQVAVVPQLGPGLFPSRDDDDEDDTDDDDDDDDDDADDDADGDDQSDAEDVSTCSDEDVAPALAPMRDSEYGAQEAVADDESEAGAGFTMQETLFVFDWDDTILPSSWIQRQGLRLDAGSVVRPGQKAKLAEVANAAAETLRLAKQQGTVVLLTNAERGWIELSCLKFLPTLLPTIENVKIVSARTTYETRSCRNPLDWKVLAFEAEIDRACGTDTLMDPEKRKNIHSLGDSVHEREALLRATEFLPNCCTKSLKFVERPDISQLLKQHALVTDCFKKVVQHGGNLDLRIDCN